MKRLVCLLSLAVSSAAAAQTSDSTSAPLRTDRVAAPLLTRPTWGEAAFGAGGVLAGGTAGALGGMLVAYALVQTTCNEEYLDGDCVLSIYVPIIAGSLVGAYVGVRMVRKGYGRGSTGGALIGYVLGSTLGSALAGGPSANENGNEVAGTLSLVGALAGAAVGFRYGPGAKGPGRPQRVALLPVATPNGSGVYAVVRF